MNALSSQIRAAPAEEAPWAAARPAAIALLLTLSACVTAPTAVRAPEKGASVPPAMAAGLERVIGKDARALEVLLGAADQDVREEGARKLQYASGVCVLDAYLYAKTPGREPVVTWIDARLPNGDDIDRASCIAALSRRAEAR
jgi:hypothetical protein